MKSIRGSGFSSYLRQVAIAGLLFVAPSVFIAVGFAVTAQAGEFNKELRMHLSNFLMGSVHANRLQNKITKWNVPLNVLILPRRSEHNNFIQALISDVKNSINHEITLVGLDTKVNVNVVIVTTPNLQSELEKGTELFKEFFFNEDRFQDVVQNLGDQARYVNTVPDPDQNLISGLIMASTTRPKQIVEKCLSIGVLQLLGFSYKEDIELLSVLTNIKIFRPTSLDLRALGYLYQSNIKAGDEIQGVLSEIN